MNLDRRQFIKSSAASAALAATGVLGQASQVIAANDKIVVGVMGVNGRGAALAKGFATNSNSQVAWLCDVDEQALARCHKAIADLGVPEPKTARDFRKLLDDKSLDALVIAAPDHWHGPATILACAAGKHVYVEKPCCHNPHEGELMVAAARKHNRVVQMGNQRRSWPKIIEAMELVRGGAIGRAYFSRAWYTNARPSIGKGKVVPPPAHLDFTLWQGPAPERPYQDNLVHYNWHWFWHWGTGELGNNGVHALDLCRWGLAVDYPTRVCSGGGRFHFNDDQETPDTQVCSWEFAGGKLISYEGRSCNRRGIEGEMFGVSFHGDHGTIVLTDSGYAHYDQNDKLVTKDSGSGGDAGHLANFLDCVRSGQRPNSDIEDGYQSTLLCLLGNISQRVGRALAIDPVSHRITSDEEALQLWGREYRPRWEPKV
jgi:predicted dehydrogenase